MKMINNYVLDREKLNEFCDCVIYDKESESVEVNSLVEDSSCYSSCVHSNNYFLTKNIQSKIKKNVYDKNYLEKVYKIPINNDFVLEELNSDFMSFLILHTSNMTVDLDTHLKEIQEDFINNNYGKQVRH